MDIYFEVGELSFPVGAAERWLAVVLAGDPEQRAVAQVFDTLEGTVDAHCTGDAFRARIVLIDAAFFQARAALGLALDAAAKLGATGTWFSGSDRSGKLSELAGGRRKVGEASARVVSTWIGEASAVFDQDMKGQFRPTPLQKPSAKATLEKKRGASTKKVRTKKKAATRR
ncbi:MAG: hypothetical protein IPJ34_36905 [Myxococcales bacterium]|nr:hypothetical protein [Myxococcales bacterium]